MKSNKNFGILILLMCIFILFNFNQLFSQEKNRKLNLDDCIRIGQERSPSANIARKTHLGSLLNYKAFKSGYLPQLSLSGSVPGLNRSIQSYYNYQDSTQVFIPQSQMSASANLSVSQKFPLTGATFYLSSGITRFEDLDKNIYSVWRTSPIQLSISQPIFQANSMAWDNEVQDLTNIYEIKHFSETMEDISISITQKFFDVYMALSNFRNAEKNAADNDTLYQLSKGRYELGKIAENDLLQSELALMNARNDLESARLDYQNSLEQLKIETGIDIDEKINVITPENVPVVEIDIEKAINEAIRNNSELLRYQIDDKQALRMVDETKSHNGFNATLTASYGLNQSAGKVDDAYRSLLDQERIDIGFQVPLFQWGKGTAEIDAALARHEQIGSSIELRKQKFRSEVKYQALKFKLLESQLVISAKADTIAARRFEVAKNRYLVGKIDLNALFIAQNEKDNALRSYIQTLKSYWMAYFGLRRLTLFDFVNNKEILYTIEVE